MPESHGSPQHPVDVWLAETLPHQPHLRAEIAADLRHRTLLPVDLPDKSFFGNVMERAIGLMLCDQPPYPDLLGCLSHQRAARLPTLAGYRPRRGTDMDGQQAWHRAGHEPHPVRIFTVAHRLAHLHELLNPRHGGRPDPEVIARILRRDPRALRNDPNDVRREWLTFSDMWTSYTSGFHDALRWYGPATAPLSLLDGLRCADFLLGTTLLEVKSGRLDQDAYLDQLIKQMLTYSLLANHDRHPVTHVAVYAVRYQRLLRYPIPPLLNRLAGTPIDITATSAGLAAVIYASQYRRAAA
jgi:hypothetical protein